MYLLMNLTFGIPIRLSDDVEALKASVPHSEWEKTGIDYWSGVTNNTKFSIEKIEII